MCSTPKPKTVVKGKKKIAGSMLSKMPSDVRNRFSKTANLADDQRQKTASNKKQRIITAQISHNKNIYRKTKVTQRNLGYWLVTASVKEIFHRLFFGKSKRI